MSDQDAPDTTTEDTEAQAILADAVASEPAKPEPPHQTAKPAGGLPEDVGELQEMVGKLRKEAGAARTNAKAKAAQEARDELTQQIGKTLGIVDGDTPPDPAELTSQLSAAQAEHRRTQVELAIYRAATQAGGDPDALLDSRSFLATLDDTDPADTATVAAAIEAAVQANPRLGVAPASRLPAPNPAQGTSANGAPSLGDQIADATKRGDHLTATSLKAQQLADIAAAQK